MTEQTITLTMSKADAEVLLGVLSSERYNRQRSRRSATRSATSSTKGWPSWARVRVTRKVRAPASGCRLARLALSV